jgi:hypothetical protein
VSKFVSLHRYKVKNISIQDTSVRSPFPSAQFQRYFATVHTVVRVSKALQLQRCKFLKKKGSNFNNLHKYLLHVKMV